MTSLKKNTQRTLRRRKHTLRNILVVLMCAAFIIGAGIFLKYGLLSNSGILSLIFDSGNEYPLLMQYRENEPEKYSLSLLTAENDYRLMGLDLVVDKDNSDKDDTITAQACAIYNVTDRSVVYSSNAFTKMYPASVTKLTTLLVALKYGNLSDEVTVTRQMLSNLEPGSSLCGIRAGDTISLNDLLYGLMLPSGNDAACAIAYHIAGDENQFANLMNIEAAALGAVDTHYVNPHGLHNTNHYTTAYDIYLIFNELLKYDKFFDIIGTQEYVANYHDKNGAEVQKVWNRGIWYFNNLAFAPPGISPLGGKTGTTPEAKYCLSLLSSDNNGKRYISVVLHADSRVLLYENMTNLLSKIDN
ncbi:MAG: D-alanyl-D-alanine carboxypeptidase [Lachnospiraceae bacterium]|nr:D-alanyl-D-alanine carboxypeptidase [Lachnospiraceae bacterium]